MNIEIKNIEKSYGKKRVLSGACFEAKAGECIGIIGANGCGKSTLFSVLAGVIRGKGEFLADGTDLMKNRKKRSQAIGYIPQGTPLIDELSAYDNLLLWYSKEAIEEMVKGDSIIKKFGVTEFLKVPVRKMSGGMKKRLSIACSVAHNPEIIIMDEPTAALDIICKQTISNYISDCKNQGKIVILATHEQREFALCDRLYLLKNGSLAPFAWNGNVDDLVEHIK